MADLDPELLALAGDESSDDEASLVSQRKSRSRSRSSTPGSVSRRRDSDSADAPRRGTARPTKRASQTPRRDQSEEGEAFSASSPNSLHSASMSESDSDDGSPAAGDDEGPLYPYEKIFTSAKDKEQIMSLPEIQREEILAERAQQVDRHKQDLLLRRLLASRDAGDGKAGDKKKRKAAVAELEDSKRKSSRQKTLPGGRKVGEPSDAIEAYKRKREQKGRRDETRRNNALSKSTGRGRRGSESSDSRASPDASGDDDFRYDARDEGSVQPQNQEDDLPVDLRDLNRALVSRSNFGQYCFYPTFDESIKGCFARVCIGPNRDHPGENEYRICQIKAITEGKAYAIEANNGRSYATTKYGLMAHGKSEKEFPFIAVSNTKFTEREFNRYRTTMIVENLEMPSKGFIKDRIAAINKLIKYNFTPEELEQKLQRQGAMMHKYAYVDKLKFEKERKNALLAGDEAAIAEADRKLAELRGPKLAFGTQLVKAAKKDEQQARIAELNRRNQKLNTENVRRAQLEELKAERKAAAAIARGEAKANPFARVKTIAKTHYDTSDADPAKKKVDDLFNDKSATNSGTNTPVGGTATPTTSSSAVKKANGATKDVAVGVTSKIRHKPYDEDILAAAVDFDIDIDI